MNWITTNLRLPEDLYMELKMKAAQERKSVAAVIREKLSEDKKIDSNEKQELLQRMEKFSQRIAVKSPGLNLTQAVIDARYQQ
ncbi:MAG: hypothetical protein ACR2LN_05150 [Candidatus Levyibacteriota bacterium]